MARAHTIAASADENATKKPSPAWSTYWPPCSRRRARIVSSCQARSRGQASSPTASIKLVERTMSVNMRFARRGARGPTPIAGSEWRSRARPDGTPQAPPRVWPIRLQALAGAIAALSVSDA